jgi:hypothetical protein
MPPDLVLAQFQLLVMQLAPELHLVLVRQLLQARQPQAELELHLVLVRRLRLHNFLLSEQAQFLVLALVFFLLMDQRLAPQPLVVLDEQLLPALEMQLVQELRQELASVLAPFLLLALPQEPALLAALVHQREQQPQQLRVLPSFLQQAQAFVLVLRQVVAFQPRAQSVRRHFQQLRQRQDLVALLVLVVRHFLVLARHLAHQLSKECRYRNVYRLFRELAVLFKRFRRAPQVFHKKLWELAVFRQKSRQLHRRRVLKSNGH